uniref:RING-type domain-containing protein n=1 Tax=Macrostomum lignano TaxID=282301 RepID=A0A1I8FFG7_9PLAT
ELVVEMQKEWDRREMADNPADPPHFNDKHDLRRVGATAAAASRAIRLAEGTGNRCRQCNTRDVEIVCLPCGHLSLCMQCSRTARTCPAINCGQNADNFVRAFVS